MESGRALIGFLAVWAAALTSPLTASLMPVPASDLVFTGLLILTAVAAVLAVRAHRRIPVSLYRSGIRLPRPPTVVLDVLDPDHPDGSGRPRPRAPTVPA
ncbi:hypothetical protein [Gordonia sp. NPDC003429]